MWVCCASIVYRSLVLIRRVAEHYPLEVCSLLFHFLTAVQEVLFECLDSQYTISLCFSERDFNMKKNQATLFLGVIDGQNYLLDVNDSGSYHAKGGQYIVVVAEDSIKVDR